ncbi:MAG: twin-arginine translocase subunit TatB [Acidobacteria bacterium]|nr:twin-arginine translocase subunit TatB [Acidobacteriota bacterium]
MFLLIFESIGTSELIMIGIVALIFLGPRKLPEIARKLGKIMADFRNTTNEFKETWEREVNFDEEAKALKELGNLDAETTSRAEPTGTLQSGISPPEVRKIDASEFKDAAGTETVESPEAKDEDQDLGAVDTQQTQNSRSEKKDWL